MKNKRQSKVLLVRMDEPLEKLVERFREKMQKSTGVPIGFSTALKLLVKKGLESL